jgi:hypothetical protein
MRNNMGDGSSAPNFPRGYRAREPDRVIGFGKPPKNQRWRVGHVQRQIKRALIASNGKPLTTSELMRRAYPRLTKYQSWRYRQVREAALRWAVRVGRSGIGTGRPLLWAIRKTP